MPQKHNRKLVLVATTVGTLIYLHWAFGFAHALLGKNEPGIAALTLLVASSSALALTLQQPTIATKLISSIQVVACRALARVRRTRRSQAEPQRKKAAPRAAAPHKRAPKKLPKQPKLAAEGSNATAEEPQSLPQGPQEPKPPTPDAA